MISESYDNSLQVIFYPISKFNNFIKDDADYRYRIRVCGHYRTRRMQEFLLIGKVQSGKTLTYTGLLAALFDRGFSMGIVLSGLS